MTLMDNSVDSRVADHGFDPPSYDRSTVQARKAGWTEGDDETLRQMFAAECSFTQMAAATGKTTGSISRRIRTFGFKLPKDYCVRQMMKARGLTGEPKIKLAVVDFKPEEHTDANVFGVADLEPHHCRWICSESVSDPVFCGLPVVRGGSWCSGHRALVFRPLEPSIRPPYIGAGRAA